MVAPKEHALQFTEFWDQRSGLTVGIRSVLFSERSPYQQVEVWDTDAFGRMLTLDGIVMVTDRDEFAYHEMLAHPPCAAHTQVKDVLIIGGGDGGTAREVLRYASVERLDVVDIDPVVTKAARLHFPRLARAFDDRRAHLHAEDGCAFVRRAAAESYDVVLVDSTDPVGPAEGLFQEPFLRDAARCVRGDGWLVLQAESPFDAAFSGIVESTRATLQTLFPEVARYVAFVPTYPMGLHSFLAATRGPAPRAGLDVAAAGERIAPFVDELRYYDVDVHSAAFVLPRFARR